MISAGRASKEEKLVLHVQSCVLLVRHPPNDQTRSISEAVASAVLSKDIARANNDRHSDISKITISLLIVEL